MQGTAFTTSAKTGGCRHTSLQEKYPKKYICLQKIYTYNDVKYLVFFLILCYNVSDYITKE